MKSVLEKLPKVLQGILIIALFYCSIYFQYIPFLLTHTKITDYTGNMRVAVLISTFADVLLLIILLFVYRKELFKDFDIFWKNKKENVSTAFHFWAFGFALMIAFNVLINTFFHTDGANNENLVRTMLHAYPFIMGIDACILAPLTEEIVFRKTIKDIFSNRYLFIIVSTLLFGLAHVAYSATTLVDWLYLLPYCSLAACFAYAYHKTDTICTSMVMHFFHNTLAILTVFLV
jgi:membrane protease YdiL (CAAX protease family)